MAPRSYYRQTPVRKVDGLVSASFIQPPKWIQPFRRSGKIARGIAYEARVKRELARRRASGRLTGELLLGPWITYVDKNGPGLAQPDALLLKPEGTIIFEVKLRHGERARDQIYKLYGPLVEFLLDKPSIGVEVFKYTNRAISRNAACVAGPEVLDFLGKKSLYFWHWLGY